MSDLATKIREYYDGAAEPVEAAEIFARLGVELQPVPRRFRTVRPVLVAATAMVVVLVAVGAAGLFGLLGGSEEFVDEPAPMATTVPASTVTSPATTEPPVITTVAPQPWAAGPWRRVPDLGVFDGSLIADIVAYGPGFVAVGAEPDLWTPQVWISVDGLDWTLVPDDTGVFTEQVGDIWLRRVGGGLVVVGNAYAPDGPSIPHLWISPDGSSWTRVPGEVAGFRSGDQISAVATGGPGLVAIGEDATSHVVFTSPDGLSWNRIPDDAGVFDGCSIFDLAAGGPGLVAVGVAIHGDGSDAAVLTSADGASWTRVTDSATFGGPGNQWMDAVASGPLGLVAVGTSYTEAGGARGAVWTSTGGLSWTSAPNDDAVFDEMHADTNESTLNLTDVAAGGAGYVAVGNGSAEDRSAILVSPDGLNWVRLSQSEIEIWVSGIIVEAGPVGVLVAGSIEGIRSDPDALTDMWMWAP